MALFPSPEQPAKANPAGIRLLLTLFIAVSLVLVLGGSYWLARQQMAEEMSDLSRSELTLLADSIRSNIVNLMNSGADMNLLDESYATLQRQHPEIIDLRVIHGPAVTRQFGVHEHELPRDDLDRQGLTSRKTLIVQREENDLDVLRFIYPLRAEKVCIQCHEARVGEQLGALSLTLDVTHLEAHIHENDMRLLKLTVAEVALLLLILFLVLNRLIFRPLQALHDGAQRMAAGDLSQPVAGESKNEMGVVVTAFNRMAGKLRKLIGEHEGVIQEQALELTQLMAASEQISAAMPLPDILHHFSKSLTQAAQVTCCRIAMLEEDGETLSTETEYPIRPLPDAAAPSCSKGKCPTLWKVIEHKNHILVHQDDPLSADERDLLRMGEAQAALCIPILHREKVYGIAVLMELRAEKREPIDERKINLCLAMISQMGAAIEIIKLYTRLSEQLMETVLAMAELVEKKSPWTAGHSRQVTHYALAIAKEMGWSEERLEGFRITGLLHDLGKIGVPGSILNKQGKLTDEEYAIVKRHPDDGAQILSKIRVFRPYIPAIRHHHEWFNGRGYPDGLKGKEIPVGARILAVADAFDAMTADRPYRKGLDREQAMHRLIEAAGEQFDPESVEAFKTCYQNL